MAETMYLVGSEDVSRAASSMRGSAELIERAMSSNNTEWVLEKHQRYMEEWLCRFESKVDELITALPNPAKSYPPEGGGFNREDGK